MRAAEFRSSESREPSFVLRVSEIGNFGEGCRRQDSAPASQDRRTGRRVESGSVKLRALQDHAACRNAKENKNERCHSRKRVGYPSLRCGLRFNTVLGYA